MSNNLTLTDDTLASLAASITASQAQESEVEGLEDLEQGSVYISEGLGEVKAGSTSRLFVQVSSCLSMLHTASILCLSTQLTVIMTYGSMIRSTSFTLHAFRKSSECMMAQSLSESQSAKKNTK